MHSVFHIRFLLIFILSSCFSTYAQSEDEPFKIKHTLRKEHSKYFKFDIYKRGLDNKIISNRLDSLSSKTKSIWTRKDSLSFAQTNILAGNYDLASHYYSKLSINSKLEEKNNIDLLCLMYLKKEYKKGVTKIEQDFTETALNSELYFLKKIIKFQDSIIDIHNWYKSNQSVFIFNIDSNVRLTKKNKEEILAPLKNACQALKTLVFYVHDNDHILSRAFRDIGYTLENHISLTQAYIAYNIGRNYNKSDKQLIEDLKRIKAKLINKNYTIPIFRRYFPKTKKSRFNYEILKEKIIKEQSDTIPKHIPNFKSNHTTFDLPFSPDLLMPFGFLIIFILLIIFLKTKRK